MAKNYIDLKASFDEWFISVFQSFDYRYIKKALENFTGVKRRGETLAVINGVKYVADYAHHPSEITATLKGVDKNETAIVFQPHTFSRTKALKKEFVNALKEFDVAIYKTFPARENFDAEGSAYSLYGELKKENFSTEYLPDEWRNITPEEKALGHGGMDYLELKAFFRAILRGEEMPVDVYDMAAWMAITPLSEQSIAHGGMPQAIPDFTRGRWILREPKDVLDLPKVETKSGDDKNEFGYSRK